MAITPIRLLIILVLAIPLLAAAEPATSVITLQPLSGSDAALRIRAALAELQRLGGGQLVLTAGRYDCRSTTSGAAIYARGLVGVTLRGDGAELVGHDPASLLSFDRCRDLTIRGLRITWEPLPHSFGRVAGVDAAARSIDLDVTSPGGAVAGRAVQALFAYDLARERLADNGWEVYQRDGRTLPPTVVTAEGRLRFALRQGVDLPQPGWDLVVRHQLYGHNALNLVNCTATSIEDVEINAAPGMALYASNSRDITVRRLRVQPPPGCHLSTTADALHFNGCRGMVTVEDSSFAGMGDDAFNIHGMYGWVAERIDDHTLAVQRGRPETVSGQKRGIWDLPQAGDRLEAGGGDQPLLPTTTITVAEAQQDAAGQRTIIRCQEPLPSGIAAGGILANVSALPAVRVRRCTVRGNRARGMLLQTRDVLVEDCRFSDTSGAALHLCADMDRWWEGPGVRAVTVQGCTIERCNFGVAHRAAAIDIFADLAKGRPSAAGVHQDIHIRDCTFAGNRGAGIQVSSASGVELRSNRFGTDESPAILVRHSRDVEIRGNQRAAGTAGAGVQMGEGCDATTVRLEGNRGF